MLEIAEPTTSSGHQPVQALEKPRQIASLPGLHGAGRFIAISAIPTRWAKMGDPTLLRRSRPGRNPITGRVSPVIVACGGELRTFVLYVAVPCNSLQPYHHFEGSMNRRAKSSGWFDAENSVRFAEATYWDGDHFISRETGSRWDHQELFRTSHGNWVLHSWSAYESVRNRFRCICESEAIQWLTRNDHPGVATAPPTKAK